MKQRRSCARDGCRAWAMQGQTLCRAHLTAEERRAAEPVSVRRQRRNFEQQIEEVVARFATEAGLEQ